MSAVIRVRMRSCWSGGKGRRVGGPAADDADGALELDPVRVDACFGGGPADQGRYGVVGEQVAVDLLADHVRAPGPQHPPGAAQVGLELLVPGLVLPALVVGLREQRAWSSSRSSRPRAASVSACRALPRIFGFTSTDE